MEAKKMKERILTAISEVGSSMRQISLDMGKSESFVASVMNGKGFPSMELVYNILYTSIIWGYSSAGRVFDWQSKGHGFEPRYLHQLIFYVFL